MSKSFKAELIFIVILQILSLFMVIATGTISSYIFLIFTIILMFSEIRRIKKYGNEKVPKITHIKFVIKTLFVAFILIAIMCIFPLTFSSSLKWKYPLQKFYINVMTSNVKFPDYFPEYIPQSAENYRLEYIQSMMQGTGHSLVEFTADSKIISEYENKFSKEAVINFNLAEYVNNESLFDEAYKDEMIKNGGDKFSSMSFYYDKDFLTENDSTKVYILESAFHRNHPHTSAVIIDSRNNRVQFSRLG